jgi:hypothetical protein
VNPIEIKIKSEYYVRMAIVGILSVGLGFLLFWLERRLWGKTFDQSGVTRVDGKKFFWNDLQEKRRVNMGNKPHAPLNNIDLIFTDGKAMVFPLMLENAAEIMSFVDKIPVQQKAV